MWTSGPQSIDTVQVSSPSGTTYVFHGKFAGGNTIVYAKALRALLENEHLVPRTGAGNFHDSGRRRRRRRHACNTRRGAGDVSDRPPDLKFVSTNTSPASKEPLPDGLSRDSWFHRSKRGRSEGRRFGRWSVPTVGGGGDMTIPSPGMARKQFPPGIGLHDPLHGR